MSESWGVLAIINGAAVCYHALGTHARWANARTLQTVYQQPDAVTLERVVLEAVELRERR